MQPDQRPWRSALYIPGGKERALDKARGLDCDAILFDLEDAVAVGEKASAREMLCSALRTGGYGPRARIVRVNGLDTAWGAEDLAALKGLEFDGVLLPKVGHPDDIAAVRKALPGVPVWAMMESPVAIANAYAIAAAPGLAGMVLGTNDLAKDLGCRHRADRLPLMLALQTCLMAARGAGLICLDGVFNAYLDEDGLEAECQQGRDLGFDGKTLIHPAQLAIANRVFAPTEAEIDLARRQIAAWTEAEAKGQGIAVVDGRIVENLHIVTARALLAKADAIAGRTA
ncbi:HpcH/HpaI aldolase/citrate lyase family protein [Frigidibacter sp. ROC022]|uniref:HpcH/HpaI aldolase/citrate lyase family protein n=1 Tax=Frigidibacter sp. ROC022 TaxID=2971796 RepID=UPI00215AF930|nr:CoA ester lyase [Frigidibacter sp. ROC022]MCR8724057.1 CoA ester lyase [Frigidibacter sp. ROC022]